MRAMPVPSHRRTERVLATATATMLLVAAGITGAGAGVPAATPHSRHVDVPKGAEAPVDKATGAEVVVLELKAPSLTSLLGAAAATHTPVDAVARAAVLAAERAAQQQVEAAATALGATVRYRYTTVLDGISVSVPAKAVPAIAAIPGVKDVLDVGVSRPADAAGDGVAGAPPTWAAGATGKGEVIGYLDTGIDFTHADFGGSGDPAAFAATNRTQVTKDSTGKPDFPTAKVIGGEDLVGDAYNASIPGDDTPRPDPVPLDCSDNAAYPHGTHTGSDGSGDGVLTSGATFTGPYNATTLTDHAFTVAPGTAPDSLIREYRVFGCQNDEEGTSDDILAKAIDDAVSDGVDVLNLSLGNPYQSPRDVDSAAMANAVASGVPVLVAAGNSGPFQYSLDGGASTPGVIAVGGVDATSTTVPTIQIGTTPALTAQRSNNSTAYPLTAPVTVLRDTDGNLAVGCDAADYKGTAGDIVITVRGTCSRVTRAQLGQDAGAAAVVMVNNADSYPPVEGDIATTDGSGTVSIPFIGLRSSQGDAMVAADGTTVTIGTPGTAPNPIYLAPASFTGIGPAPGDSSAKPDVAADAVDMAGAHAGSGTGSLTGSGTSFATPTVAGLAADLLEAEPGITTSQVKAALDNTADPTQDGYDPLAEGAGIAKGQRALASRVFATTGSGVTTGLSFGYQQLSGAYSGTQVVTVANTSSSAVTYDLVANFIGTTYDATATVSPATVTVAAGASSAVTLTLSLTADQVAALPDAENNDVASPTVAAIRGDIVATPTDSVAAHPALSVPYVFVPRGVSTVTASTPAAPTGNGTTSTTTTTLTNSGSHSGGSDVYAWAIHDGEDAGVTQDADVEDVGYAVRTGADNIAQGTDTEVDLVFDTAGTFSSPVSNVYDFGIDTNGDGVDDYIVRGEDCLSDSEFYPIAGQECSVVLDAAGNELDEWTAETADNGNMIVLPFVLGDIGSPTGPFAFRVADTRTSYGDRTLTTAESSSYATLDAAHPPVNTGDGGELDPGDSRTATLTVDLAEQQVTPALGWLVSTFDDANGTGQLNEIATATASSTAGVPGAPTGVAATPGDGRAAVSFTAPTSDGRPVTGYTITATAPSGIAVTPATTAAASPATVTGLTNGTAYTFTVTATNSVGTGTASQPSTPVTPFGKPTAPGSVTATRANAAILATWSAAGPNGSAVTSYTVTATPAGGGAATSVVTTAATAAVRIAGLVNGTAYTVTVVGTNAAGTGLPGTAAGPVTPAAVPDAPTGVTAVAGDGVAAVSWTAPAANGAPLTGYRVTATPGGATVTTTGTSATVTGLTDGTLYFFTVVALNSLGAGPVSAASSPVTPLSPIATVTLAVSPTFVTTGQPAVFSGRVLHGAVAAVGVPVTLSETYVDGKVVPIGAAVTGADGSYATTVVPVYNGLVTATAPGATSPGVLSKVIVVFNRLKVTAKGGRISVSASSAPGFLTGPNRQERAQIQLVDAAGTVLKVLATVNAAQRTGAAGQLHGANDITYTTARALQPGTYRIVVKVLGTPVNTGAPSSAIAVKVS